MPRKYWQEFHDEWLSGVGELIQVVSEAGADSDAYGTARAMLMDAARVVFLGFGYHEQNMTRLGLGKDKVFPGVLLGSSYGFTQLERARLQERWKVGLSGIGAATLQYLREEVGLD